MLKVFQLMLGIIEANLIYYYTFETLKIFGIRINTLQKTGWVLLER
jgi:hypothetical protein